MISNIEKRFGTAPVFFTAISTILGAILFLRFGYAVGTLGFWGVILIILLGHLVTIPTALAISEIATNKRVEGGGEYFIISRSFGLNIGATIGMALYLSQAISVAFYIIAFTEAFEPVFNYFSEVYFIDLPRQVISIPSMLILAFLISKRGANMGVKALYLVIAVLFISLILFFLGKTGYAGESGFSIFNDQFRNSDDFFKVFAIVFPAFTGMTAGVGLSGDLKNPSKSIPFGTTAATITGGIIYMFVVWKLAYSASPDDLLADQLIMRNIALGGAFIIPLGLAASTLSSALGSVMVAPRTLQALAVDQSFPSKKINKILAKGREKDGEPYNATLVTSAIALLFVALGSVNAVAEIISMFFMVTYGALSLISFLNHFGSSPAYRPYFKSKWYISLTGFLVAVWVMFKINALYALFATILISALYLYISTYHKNRKGLEAIFSNALFQINRNLQVFLQKSSKSKTKKEWRPSAICISEDSFQRDTAFNLLNWISYKYGFGTYIHRIQGYYSKATYQQSLHEFNRLLEKTGNVENHVYIDTIISPSYTSAIAQAIQLPGISGMENNMVVFEFDKENPQNLSDIVENYALVHAGNFDICILASSQRPINFNQGIHIWIRAIDHENSNLMILLSFIISGYPDWKKSNIKIFEVCKPEKEEETKTLMKNLVISGRLPVTFNNIEIIAEKDDTNIRSLINSRSGDAGLTLIGFRGDHLKHEGAKIFSGYTNLGTILFVNSHTQKEIE
ncbi:MAG: amino acid permease [Bacteroidales bacterium]|nr:amino acid permease [Bacteroidales bacterium]